MHRKRRNPIPGIIILTVLLATALYVVLLRTPSGGNGLPGKYEPAPSVYTPGEKLVNADSIPYSPPQSAVCLREELGIYMLSGDELSQGSSLYAAGPYLWVLSPGNEGSRLICMDTYTARTVRSFDVPGLVAEDKGTVWFCGTLDDGAFWLGLSGDDGAASVSVFPCYVNSDVFSVKKDVRASYIAVTADGCMLIMLSGRDFICCDLQTGEERRSSAPEGVRIPETLFMSPSGTLFGCSSNGSDICTVDPSDWNICPVQSEGELSVICRSFAARAGFDSTSASLVPLDDPSQCCYLPGESSTAMRASGQFSIHGGCLTVIDTPEQSHPGRRVYSLVTGEMLQYVKYGADCADYLQNTSMVSDSNYGWCAYIDTHSRIQIIPIDRDMFLPSETSVSERFPHTECGDTAREIYTHTGVFVHWGEDGSDFNVPYFAADSADDGSVNGTMRVLRDFLLSLPEKMIPEMLMGTADELHVYLCRDVRSVPDLGFDMGGFTELNGDGFTVVFDVEDDYWTLGNIAHEFWHVMEYRMAKLEELSGRPFLSGWLGLMPEEIRGIYLEEGSRSISNEWLSKEQYTPDGEADPERVWFVRSYSVSDPGEDRATVFETANWEEKYPMLQKYPHLRDKAGYVFSLIRVCYPSCASFRPLPWELRLGEGIPVWFFDRNGVNRIG